MNRDRRFDKSNSCRLAYARQVSCRHPTALRNGQNARSDHVPRLPSGSGSPYGLASGLGTSSALRDARYGHRVSPPPISGGGTRPARLRLAAGPARYGNSGDGLGPKNGLTGTPSRTGRLPTGRLSPAGRTAPPPPHHPPPGGGVPIPPTLNFVRQPEMGQATDSKAIPTRPNATKHHLAPLRPAQSTPDKQPAIQTRHLPGAPISGHPFRGRPPKKPGAAALRAAKPARYPQIQSNPRHPDVPCARVAPSRTTARPLRPRNGTSPHVTTPGRHPRPHRGGAPQMSHRYPPVIRRRRRATSPPIPAPPPCTPLRFCSRA